MLPPRPQLLSDLLVKEIPPQPMWISKGILPKSGIMVFGGLPKAGKSFLTLNLSRALALGEPLFNNPDFHTQQARVVLVEHELGEYGLQKRVLPIFKDVDPSRLGDNFVYFSKEHSLEWSTPQGKRFFHSIVETTQPEVLVLDPIGKMFSGNENDNSEIGALFAQLDELVSLGRPWGMSIVLVHHFKKPPENEMGRKGFDDLDPLNFRGSSRWYADPDTLLTLARRKKFPLPYEAWNLDCRFTFRQDEGMDDFTLSVNEHNDGRVRWKGLVEKAGGGLPALKQQGGFPQQEAVVPAMAEGSRLKLFRRV